MKVSFGFKAHSGWAALVVVGGSKNKPEIVDRQRIELVEEEWAKAPYHAAEELEEAEARALVSKGIQAAHKNAKRQIRELIKRHEGIGNEVVGCAVLMGNPMPEWSTDQILAVHFRMHKAEGVLFREALASASQFCKLPFVPVSEKELNEFAVTKLKCSSKMLIKTLTGLGKQNGPPWGSDQKEATLAALIALHGTPS